MIIFENEKLKAEKYSGGLRISNKPPYCLFEAICDYNMHRERLKRVGAERSSESPISEGNSERGE